MALVISTKNASALLAAIKQAIDDNEIDSWTYDKNGDFTHTPSQWRNLARLHPIVDINALKFGIIGHKDTVLSRATYCAYHGRFTEMLLAHFASKVPSVGATSKPLSAVDFVNDLG
ncbi:hypothetical protein [Geothrix campi]|jgi:hypothetical protein|uniref:hypothetical protein n=1 Tax=Geothrix campi TaxID=2966450 RepID=UPI0021473899|nr:hypothetical protein [Geothrix sp. SG10]